MKAFILIIMLTVFSGTMHAFEPHVATYQLSINGFKIAEESRELRKLNKHYLYIANAATSGVLAIIKYYTINAESSFKINQNGVDSLRYKIIKCEDGDIDENYSIEVFSTNNSVVSKPTKTKPKIITWEAKPGNIVDSLSLFLALSYDVQNKPELKQLSYQVADGESVEIQRYKKTINQSITIFGTTYNDAVKIERVDNKNKDLQVYLVPKYQYLPVFIKLVERGNKYVYEINNFKLLEK